jgi:hypothetical protein
MSNRKLRTMTIAATLSHDARPQRAGSAPQAAGVHDHLHTPQGSCTPGRMAVKAAGPHRGLRGVVAYKPRWNHDRALSTATGRHSVARCQRRRACE